MAVLASIEPSDLQVQPGSEAWLTVRVRNRGSIVDRFDITVVGPMARWASVEPQALRLFPDKEGDARVAFRPPRASTPIADTYPFGIAVRSAADPADSMVEEGRITVAPFIELATEIVPQTSRGSRSAKHDLTVKNRGNAVAEVFVRASDPDRLLAFDVRPPRIGVKPDDDVSIRTVVRPRDTFLMGSPQRIPFFLQVDEPMAGSRQIAAALEQRPIIPGWVKPLTGLAVAGIAAALILPRVLGLDGQPSPEPTTVAIATTAPPETIPPVTIPPTVQPSLGPTYGPPERLVVAGWETDLSQGAPVILKCENGDEACRGDAEAVLLRILDNLQGRADGAKLTNFESTPVGTLPLLAEWSAGATFPFFSTDGTSSQTDKVRFDLAPVVTGYPAYVMVHQPDNLTRWFVVPPEDGRALFEILYVSVPEATPAPVPSGGVGLDYSQVRLVPEWQWVWTTPFVASNP